MVDSICTPGNTEYVHTSMCSHKQPSARISDTDWWVNSLQVLPRKNLHLTPCHRCCFEHWLVITYGWLMMSQRCSTHKSWQRHTNLQLDTCRQGKRCRINKPLSAPAIMWSASSIILLHTETIALGLQNIECRSLLLWALKSSLRLGLWSLALFQWN